MTFTPPPTQAELFDEEVYNRFGAKKQVHIDENALKRRDELIEMRAELVQLEKQLEERHKNFTARSVEGNDIEQVVDLEVSIVIAAKKINIAKERYKEAVIEYVDDFHS